MLGLGQFVSKFEVIKVRIVEFLSEIKWAYYLLVIIRHDSYQFRVNYANQCFRNE